MLTADHVEPEKATSTVVLKKTVLNANAKSVKKAKSAKTANHAQIKKLTKRSKTLIRVSDYN